MHGLMGGLPGDAHPAGQARDRGALFVEGGQCPPGAHDAADPTARAALLIGAAVADAPERARAASPVARVHADAPPFLVLHGALDTLIPLAQGGQLAAALHQVGARVDFRPVPGADHGWAGLSDEEVERIFSASVDFAHACTAGPMGHRRRRRHP
ncbi:prolyl oligopeptidase family serine peptidase [Streptomyces xanthophaeus]|uniref:prolyl oligopeptidase family serine peptidase n=1 Tax=Streptomyces xanthophaeus TaxID=67385 RepID=UPI00342D7002